ncbi:hypothetical protein V8J88_20020 [Massilia sp. W12]|uniref:hypothetical protein n=1 Tax=Massilia sp. W12 TaxID=3126507 RepID=UPI0030CF5C94
MRMMNMNAKHLGGMLLLGLLSACGGGGSGAGSPAPVTPPVQSTPISSSNFMQVAAQAYNSGDALSGQGGSGSNSGGGASMNLNSKVGDIYNAVKNGAASLPDLNNRMTDNCRDGGTIDLNIRLNASRSLAAGAQIDLTASNCIDSGVKFDGGASMSIAAGSNSFEYGLNFQNFSLSSATERFVLNGDGKFSSVGGKVVQSGSAMYIAYYKNGALVTERSLSNYSMSNGNSGYQISGVMQFKNQALGTIPVTVSTEAPFTPGPQGFPISGKMVISGSGNTKITLTPTGNQSVKVDFSDKPDGSITLTQTVTFDQLKAMQ